MLKKLLFCIYRKIRFVKNVYLLNIKDAYSFIRFSNGFFYNDNKKKMQDNLIVLYHPIEKGLCMPEFRPGFGKDKIIDLIKLCNSYVAKYGNADFVMKHISSVLLEYQRFHKDMGYSLDKDLEQMLESFFLLFDDVEVCNQLTYSREQFYSKMNLSFIEFAHSRHSVRNYDLTRSIDLNVLKKSVREAMSAPSTCNRQSVKIHIVKDHHKVVECMRLQCGNKGFGHLADSVIVITSDLQSWGMSTERNAPYIDGGIMTMNLLYFLHYNGIAACPLNWSEKQKKTDKLKALLDIPQSEVIILLISCGIAPEEFKVVRSRRKPFEEICVIH